MRRILAWLKKVKWLKVGGYGGLFIFSFLLSLYLTFPYDSIRDYAIRVIQSRADVSVKIDNVSTFRLTGIKAKGLKIASQEDPTKVYLNLDEVRLRVRPTQMMRRRLWIDFDVYGYGGGVAGSLCKRGTVWDVAMNFAGLKFAEYSTRELFKNLGSINIEGNLNGELDAHLNRALPRVNYGALNLGLDHMKTSNVMIAGQKIPDMTFEPGKIDMELQHQSLQVKEFDLKGNHLEMQLNGRINTNMEDIKKSRLALTCKIKPSDEMEDALGPMMYALKEPDANGFYTIPINGVPGNLRAGRR